MRSCFYSQSSRQPRVRVPARLLLLVISACCAGCSTLEPYRISGTTSDVAFVEDDRPGMYSDFFRQILSIDRKRINSESRRLSANWSVKAGELPGDLDNWIPLRTGLRKLEVQVCEYDPSLWDLIAWSGWHCGHAVLALKAESGGHYRLNGTVNKKEDYAELWIENARSEEVVTDVTRVAICDLEARDT